MTFATYQDNDGRFHRRLVGDDGIALARSATGFDPRKDARRAAADMRPGAGSAGDAQG